MCLSLATSLSRRKLLLSAVGSVAAFSTMGTKALCSEYVLPKRIVGVRIPDTELARDAAHLMFTAAPRTLYNHSLRTFVLGMISAKRRNLKIDEEVAFHASILHDLGLTQPYHGDSNKSFEENSALLAVAFARAAGMGERRAENVHKAIILHAGRAFGEPADVEFVMEGARQDVTGPTVAELSDSEMLKLEEEIPRLNFKTQFLRILESHLVRTEVPTWTEGFARNPPPNFITNRWSE